MQKTLEIDRLLVNGCSYMQNYVFGNGHRDLATLLEINPENALSNCMSGGCNTRIIRTTLDDCYSTDKKTLYVIGLSFVHRFELPMLHKRTEADEKFLSFSSCTFKQPGNKPIDGHINEKDVTSYINLKSKFDFASEEDRLIEQVYSITAMIDSVLKHGHSVVLFNTADTLFHVYRNHKKLQYLKKYKQVVDSLVWRSNGWQFEQGAKSSPSDYNIPVGSRHVDIGEHKYLNNFLVNYIRDNALI
jgi:hypothetical protein